MQPAPSTSLAPPPIPAMPQLSEKPHQGFATKKTALHPASSVPNFRVTLGLRAVVVENGVREIYSARYYNPNTGRFMSRDPYDGDAKIPATLHKYLYAGGDPVNLKDPTGRDWLEYKLLLKSLVPPAALGLRIAAAAICAEFEAIDRLLLEPLGKGIPWPAMLPCDSYAIGEGIVLIIELM